MTTPRLIALTAAVTTVVALLASPAAGSVLVTKGSFSKPTLKVDSAGNAEVGWRTANGQRQTLLFPPTGKNLPGATISGKNVLKKAGGVKIPFRVTLKQAPNGTLYALQAWKPRKGAPKELRFSRWTGDPTQLVLGTSVENDREKLAGAATLGTKGVFGKSLTPGGKKLQTFVFLDCNACTSGGKGWQRIASRKPAKPSGTFALNVLPSKEGARYRAQLIGKNTKKIYAPDAQVVVRSAREPA
ncbi:MAG: hypothetical protein ACR2OD_03495 [Gaiellaceae bacterium]